MQVELKRIQQRRRHHLRLRHARPGGGADDERPPRRLQRTDGSSRSATPAEVYEQPGERVRRRLRRRLQRAGARRAPLHRPAREGPLDAEGDGPARRGGADPRRRLRRDDARATSSTSTGAASCRWSARTSRRPRRTRSSSKGRKVRSDGATSTPRDREQGGSHEGSRDGGARDRRGAVARRSRPAVGRGAPRSSAARSRRRTGRRPCPSSAKGEGKVNLIAWAGYVEDGSTDPKVDWVSDFEKETGCQVNVKVGNTSDEMVTLMRTGQYDGVSASGDATLRLIAGGDVAPVNTDLVPNYADVFDGAEGPALQLGRRPDVRRPARPRREPADVAHRTRSSRRPTPGAPSSTRPRRTRARSPPTTTRSTSPTRRCT